jgi:hypothetical protein
MTKSDSLDNITLDSYEIKNIENFEKNYYNHKNNRLQNGGNNNKLEKNIIRLYNCYVLSQNQNGGNKNNLSLQIKKRFDKKIDILTNNLIGGVGGINNGMISDKLKEYIKDNILPKIKTEIIPEISKWLNEESNVNAIKTIIETHIIPQIPNIINHINPEQIINTMVSNAPRAAADALGNAAASGASAVGSVAASGASAVGSVAASGASVVGSVAASGASVVGNMLSSTVSRIFTKKIEAETQPQTKEK